MNSSVLLAVGLGGFLGAITRFYINTIVSKTFPYDIPLATLGVNVVGSFAIGLLIGLFLFFTPSDTVKAFLITGFLGALTTYSTFAIESFFLLQSSLYYAILNMILNLIGSIVAAGSGYKLITYFLK
ncbi:MAG: fluoride efflux transporter CrcB [Campylobacteraceae bacterium]|jgi:CrcB protein|nr:fluoride efflux transporter CrcB [Campylobacteraceae bacterium]MBT3881905.1 fluoride efflux transporter CrcB [Campylobacteraceae bacterium]MBT4030771.1 fluoride efflux transporter CrcB [Campylobacteraceae bacterium]MBT4178740.1 fluoride efflux transporter CrcB [Campylobacteraceae bacterium]MBT4572103.1 fluoride efflux transporter CrcB [Campylobacteraceae bacterium]